MRAVGIGAVLVMGLGSLLSAQDSVPNATLTAVPGVKVGHVTLPSRPTGCTGILTVSGAVAGVDVRGAAPGTRETDLLNPVNTVDRVHAIVLSQPCFVPGWSVMTRNP